MDTISLAIGGLMPLLLGVINKEHWPPAIKSVVAFFVCLLAAAVTVLAKGGLDAADPIATFAAIYTAAMVSFHGLWQPTGIADTVERNVLP